MLQGITICLLVRSHTSIRVPKVLAWNSNAANSVGAEYLILEKVAGVPLSEKWDDMSDVDRYKLIERVVEVETELASLRFPAYGSLYFADFLPDISTRWLLGSAKDPSGSFCIGPPCSRPWLRAGFLDNIGREIESGPCQSISSAPCHQFKYFPSASG